MNPGLNPVTGGLYFSVGNYKTFYLFEYTYSANNDCQLTMTSAATGLMYEIKINKMDPLICIDSCYSLHSKNMLSEAVIDYIGYTQSEAAYVVFHMASKKLVLFHMNNMIEIYKNKE